MVVNTTLLTIAKYGFLGLTITCAGVLIAMTTVMKHEMVPDDFSYNDSPSLPYQNSSSIFDRHFSRCLTAPANPFCLKRLDDTQPLVLLRSKFNDTEQNDGTTKTTANATKAHLLGDFLRDFSSLLVSLGVRSFLIEPSTLFCLMSPASKLRVLTDGFVPARTLGSRNVVTFGVMAEEAMTIDEDSAMGRVLSAGFEISRSRRWHGPWVMRDSGSTLHTTHYFFLRGNFMVHLVTFFESGNFFWHSDLSPEEGKGLLFREESMYEKFSLLPFGDGILPGLRIPSDPQFFLLQIESSRVLPPLSELKDPHGEGTAQSGQMTREQMSFRAFVAIEDLKNRLRPEGVSFWMRSLSLLGWYLHGDIFSISDWLNFAAYFRTLNDSTVRSLFFDNDYLKMETRFSSPDQDFGYDFDCHGLVVSLAIGREDKNGLFSIQERGDLLKQTIYPKFELCSADIVGQKVLVPCKPEEIFTAEFGDQWREMFSFLDS